LREPGDDNDVGLGSTQCSVGAETLYSKLMSWLSELPAGGRFHFHLRKPLD
jgi:hypothetical protein